MIRRTPATQARMRLRTRANLPRPKVSGGFSRDWSQSTSSAWSSSATGEIESASHRRCWASPSAWRTPKGMCMLASDSTSWWDGCVCRRRVKTTEVRAPVRLAAPFDAALDETAPSSAGEPLCAPPAGHRPNPPPSPRMAPPCAHCGPLRNVIGRALRAHEFRGDGKGRQGMIGGGRSRYPGWGENQRHGVGAGARCNGKPTEPK